MSWEGMFLSAFGTHKNVFLGPDVAGAALTAPFLLRFVFRHDAILLNFLMAVSQPRFKRENNQLLGESKG